MIALNLLPIHGFLFFVIHRSHRGNNSGEAESEKICGGGAKIEDKYLLQ